MIWDFLTGHLDIDYSEDQLKARPAPNAFSLSQHIGPEDYSYAKALSNAKASWAKDVGALIGIVFEKRFGHRS